MHAIGTVDTRAGEVLALQSKIPGSTTTAGPPPAPPPPSPPVLPEVEGGAFEHPMHTSVADMKKTVKREAGGAGMCLSFEMTQYAGSDIQRELPPSVKTEVSPTVDRWNQPRTGKTQTLSSMDDGYSRRYRISAEIHE